MCVDFTVRPKANCDRSIETDGKMSLQSIYMTVELRGGERRVQIYKT
jgi:hypothetical protein